jgi:MFS superfamily sulfate permease-like transporter
VFGVIPGIGIAIGIAVIEFLWDGWRPHHAVLGRVNGIRGYHDIKRYPAVRCVPGLVLRRRKLLPDDRQRSRCLSRRARDRLEASRTCR